MCQWGKKKKNCFVIFRTLLAGIFTILQTLEVYQHQEQVNGLFLMASWITSEDYMFIQSI